MLFFFFFFFFGGGGGGGGKKKKKKNIEPLDLRRLFNGQPRRYGPKARDATGLEHEHRDLVVQPGHAARGDVGIVATVGKKSHRM